MFGGEGFVAKNIGEAVPGAQGPAATQQNDEADRSLISPRRGIAAARRQHDYVLRRARTRHRHIERA